ncbi:carboxypeptidase regulatory-like domain-containing protein [Paractinoplanes globisporus]|uniref:Carboxypeptidase regulatory-like domain-containing protein n=1 Tax=Paractinoplanes globisporus TaxID=113565 RepID=A0ABW6W8E1_9ACTN|nr:carboxypeptidase regulatory-like domain-containing protein [Actinoplanes globisporus]
MRRALAAALAATVLTVGGYAPRPAAASLPELAGGKRADIFVVLRDRADLSAVARERGHAAKTTRGYQLLRDTADRSQRDLRAQLTREKVSYQPFWAVNAVLVRGADAALAARLAARPDVAAVRPNRTYRVPDLADSKAAAAAGTGVEWNIAQTRAPQVWSGFGTRGDGIVVASIDTGVQYDHPSLVRQYRGNKGNGAFDHNYNWYDPFRVCGAPTTGPCDNNGHGTHTMGTMVGDDGAGNQTGMAPGAQWIAAKGCEGETCTTMSLLLAGEWVLAPTDLNGQNPRPDLAPDVVNDSWGADVSDAFFADVVSRWTQVGIFPAFAAGNTGPTCGTVGSPADYANTYAVAAYGSDGAIADFSSRGSAGTADVKPDIAAPGVDVRSTVPGGKFLVASGTSMATPHVAGAVALLWSAAPALIGDIAATRQVLDGSAVDVADTSCGGTATDNQVWGQGKLDVYAAVQAAPRGPVGRLSGTVTTSAGAALSGATVDLTGDNKVQRHLVTAADGTFSVSVPVGTYQATARAFGYADRSVTGLVVRDGQTTSTAFALTASARYTLQGTVADGGGFPVPGVSVQLAGTPLAAVKTDTAGAYRIDGVPPGDYPLTTSGGACVTAGTKWITVAGASTVRLTPPPVVDTSGYHCQQAAPENVAGTSTLALTGDDAATAVFLPFLFPFYDNNYVLAYVSTNGFLNFQKSNFLAINRPVPTATVPNAAVFGLWDDLVIDSAASVRTATLGAAPNREFVIEWHNAAFYGSTERATFAIVLHESGQISIEYGDLTGSTVARGGGATVGVENAAGAVGIQYSMDSPVLTPHTAVSFRISGAVTGTVTGPDGMGLPAATVRATRDGTVVSSTATDAIGGYVLHLPLGTYQLEAVLDPYAPTFVPLALTADGVTVTQNLAMRYNSFTLTGVARDDLGVPIEGATVTLRSLLTDDTFAPVTTGADGAYTFTGVADPGYNLAFSLTAVAPPCLPYNTHDLISVHGDSVQDIVLHPVDGFGYQCRTAAQGTWTDGATAVPLTPISGPDGYGTVALPFPFRFYRGTYTTAYVTSAGYLTFLKPVYVSGSNDNLPADQSYAPDAAVYPFWDGLTVDASASVRTAVTGAAPNRAVVVEWRNVLLDGTGLRLTFEAMLHENGRITLSYKNIPADTRAQGASATIGIEDEQSRDNLEYAYYEPAVRAGMSITLRAPGIVRGRVTDAAGLPVAGATVQAAHGGIAQTETVTAADGTYQLQAPLGRYTLTAVLSGRSAAADVTLPTDWAEVTQNLVV